ncbi:MAG: hypothetical protein E6929_12405 [Clostridium sp.]|nr:hypothetical protein [Clostridium sp.]
MKKLLVVLLILSVGVCGYVINDDKDYVDIGMQEISVNINL